MPRFVFYSFFLSHLSSQITRRREERKKQGNKKKRILKACQSFDNTSPVPLERSRWEEFNDIKKGHQWWPERATRDVRRQMSPETFWSDRVAHYDHRSWPSLILLDSSRRYLSNSTSSVIIKILVYLWDFFFLVFLSFLSFYCKLCQYILELKSHRWSHKCCFSNMRR